MNAILQQCDPAVRWLGTDHATAHPDMRWPAGFFPEDADLFAHSEIVIEAPAALVWRHLVNAAHWPLWYPYARQVRIRDDPDGPLGHRSRFHWSAFGLRFDTDVIEFTPHERLAWFSRGVGMHAYHAWLVAAVPGGCRVVSEEVMRGSGAVAWRDADPELMYRRYDTWLDRLRLISQM